MGSNKLACSLPAEEKLTGPEGLFDLSEAIARQKSQPPEPSAGLFIVCNHRVINAFAILLELPDSVMKLSLGMEGGAAGEVGS